MSAAQKTWVPGASAKEKTFSDGGALIKLGFKVADLIEFAKQNGNAAGYLNLTLSRRREVGRFGETHSVYLDDYVPKGGGQPRQPEMAEEPPF